MLRFVFLAGFVLCLSMLSTASCGGDDETGSGGSGNTGNTMGGNGAGGAVGGTMMTGGGGGVPALGCDADAKCKASEPCACQDCWLEPKCASTANCNDDGMCTEQEGCHCADCSNLGECDDYCLDCHAYLTYYTDPATICNPGSQALYDALDDCACTSICVTECAQNFCNSQLPSQACIDCIDMSCKPQYDACFADIEPFVQCNPVTNEPCNETADQEHCDRVLVGDEVVGWQCNLRTQDALLCDACNYNFGGTYCFRGHTCGDGLGDISVTGTCARYCCDDGDCGTGTCLKGVFSSADPDVGICDTQVGGAGCDAPADAPSLGSCVSITP
jgi:hypothetical protein